MALPLWSQLQKSQTDPETIEEAIERIVAAHNDDPDAHLEGDRSLEAHKNNGTIDHPELSVVRDKVGSGELDLRWFPFDRLILFSNFGENGGWDNFGTGNSDIYWMLGQTQVLSGDTSGNYMAITSNAGNVKYPIWTDDFIWQSTLSIGHSTNIFANFGLCTAQPFSGYRDGVSFRFEDGQMYAGYAYNFGTEVYTAVTTPTIGSPDYHTYRIHYVQSEDVLYYYIDGEEVHTVSSPPQNMEGAALSGYEVETKENDMKYLYLQDMQLSLPR